MDSKNHSFPFLLERHGVTIEERMGLAISLLECMLQSLD